MEVITHTSRILCVATSKEPCQSADCYAADIWLMFLESEMGDEVVGLNVDIVV